MEKEIVEEKTKRKQGELKTLLLEIDGGYIIIPRKLNLILGIKATGLLTELCDKYDYYKETDQLTQEGEFYQTVADVEINVGLTKTEQKNAIEILKTKCFIQYTTQRGMPKQRYFKMSNEIPKLIENVVEEYETKKSTIKEASDKEVKRCKEACNPVESAVGIKHAIGSNKTCHLIEGNMTSDSTKHAVINNYDKELELKTNIQEQECLSVPTEVKEYNTLVYKLIKIFPDTDEKKIEARIKKMGKDTGHTYEDINLSFDFKEKTIEYLLSKDSGELQFNNVMSSIKKGIYEAKEKQKEQELECEEINQQNCVTFGELEENTEIISKEEETIEISADDRKKLSDLKMMNAGSRSLKAYITLFKDVPTAKDIYKTILEPFANTDILIFGFTRQDIVNFNLAYQAIRQLEGIAKAS